MKSALLSKPPTWLPAVSTVPLAVTTTSASSAFYSLCWPSTVISTRSGCCTIWALALSPVLIADQRARQTGAHVCGRASNSVRTLTLLAFVRSVPAVMFERAA